MNQFILNNSEATDIDMAWKEWLPVKHNKQIDKRKISPFYTSICDSFCLCGKAITYVYQIKNSRTGVVFPKNNRSTIGIGSSCINQFIRGYKFPIYERKTKDCSRCGVKVKGVCVPCSKYHLKGVIYCVNRGCIRRIYSSTKKEFGNKVCRKCNA
jgi:hypothetical protein